MRSTFALASFVTLLGSLTLACGERQVGADDDIGTGDDDGIGSDDHVPLLSVNEDVDILFVIDNSGSMGEEQARLAVSAASLIEVLDATHVNYRIGVTTSDNGNPWCPAGSTTPEAGQLVLSSCKDRLGDFSFSDTVDVQDLACNDLCNLSSAQLEILPTTTDVDANQVARPWIERIEGETNLPPGTAMAEAFKCFAPQGVNGCGFESQLESMYLALARAADNNDASYGFLRDRAVLAIVLVTDEVDCSHNEDWADIFAQDGNKVFWSDPSASFPTSALCWNAGVACTGDPSSYDACEPVNKDIEGNPGAGDAEAVLHPMRRYLDRVQGIENSKKDLNPDQELIVALVAGAAEDGSVLYADAGASDPEFQASFGIGPGCVSPEGAGAVPPVRMRDFAETFTPDSVSSICSPDYTPAFEALAASIRTQLPPACYPQCVRDTDPMTAILEPDCTVEQKRPGADIEALDECKRDAEGNYAIDPVSFDYVLPADDVDVCYAQRVDSANLSADPADDLSPECKNLNYVLEFEIGRRVGVPAPGGTGVRARCALSDFPSVDCPDIGTSG